MAEQIYGIPIWLITMVGGAIMGSLLTSLRYRMRKRGKRRNLRRTLVRDLDRLGENLEELQVIVEAERTPTQRSDIPLRMRGEPFRYLEKGYAVKLWRHSDALDIYKKESQMRFPLRVYEENINNLQLLNRNEHDRIDEFYTSIEQLREYLDEKNNIVANPGIIDHALKSQKEALEAVITRRMRIRRWVRETRNGSTKEDTQETPEGIDKEVLDYLSDEQESGQEDHEKDIE